MKGGLLRIALFALVTVLLGGCATQSMLEYQRMVSAEQEILARVRECQAGVNSQSKFSSLLEKLPPTEQAAGV